MKKIKFDSKKVMVYFIAFIMVSSVFGIIFSGYRQRTASLEYNGFKFSRENDAWAATIGGKKMYFDYYPGEVEFINVTPGIADLLKNTYEIDATSEPESDFKDTIALLEYNMAAFLNDNLNIYLRIGFTEDNDYDKPVILCEDATMTVPVIYFKISNKTAVNLENNCITAEAKNDFDFIRVKDVLVYSILGIIR